MLAYAPSDSRELGFRERMLALLDGAGSAAFARDHFVPGHFTASAFVLSPDGAELLLIFHRKLELWLQPGGHVEVGDLSLGAAARREAMEELGVALPASAGAIFDVDIHAIPARKSEPAHQHFDVRFRLVAEAREFRASDEVADARWVKLQELASVTSDESVLRAARKLASEKRP